MKGWHPPQQQASQSTAPFRSTLTSFDRALLVVLACYGALALLALATVPHFYLPAEDAIILYAYSRNLAHTGAITFLTGGPHVEGATDFGWMLLVAAANKLGIASFRFSAFINVLSLAGLALVLLRLAKLKPSLRAILVIAGAAALFPQIFAAASGFAVLPDAFLLSLLCLFVVQQRLTPVCILALIFCLFRPDALLFVTPLLLSLIVSSKHRLRAFAWVSGLLVLPGTLYFLWRVHYFHELLPLPFLVKSDTPRIAGFFVPHSVQASLLYLVLVALVWITLVRLHARNTLVFGISLVVVPTLFYWSMRLDQNVGARFFYYLPLATALLLAAHWSELLPHRALLLRGGFVAWLVLFAMPLYRESRSFRDEQFDNAKSIAIAMSRLPHGTLLTTEAGFLPFYSGWNSIDAAGLNTPAFAHHFIQPADVERLQPDLIVVHPNRGESCTAEPDWAPGYPDRTWSHLTRNVLEGAQGGGYELWLTSYGSEFYRQRKHWAYGEGDPECWLLRRQSPLHAALCSILRAHHGVPPVEAARPPQPAGPH